MNPEELKLRTKSFGLRNRMSQHSGWN